MRIIFGSFLSRAILSTFYELCHLIPYHIGGIVLLKKKQELREFE